jgi:hypothetical protein
MSAIKGDIASEWSTQQIKRFGGRAAWLAHHLVFLHRFFDISINQKQWDPGYGAGHRLVHYEQMLKMAARVCDMPDGWIRDKLVGSVRISVTEADWAIEALVEFVEYWEKQHGEDVVNKPFSVTEIHDWGSSHEEYEDNHVMQNARRLGRYIASHRDVLYRTVGIKEAGTRGNKQIYRVDVGQRKEIAKQNKMMRAFLEK